MAVLLGALGHSAERRTAWEAALASAFTSACLSLLLLAVASSLSGHRPIVLAVLQPAQIECRAAGTTLFLGPTTHHVLVSPRPGPGGAAGAKGG